MKVGLVGAGYWGPNLARVLAQTQKCEFVAACDLDPMRLQRITRQYPCVKPYGDYDEMLQSGLDAVVIATPISTHYRLANKALTAGLHTFVEKPLAGSSEQCGLLSRLAVSKGLTLAVGHTFIYSPPVRKIKQLITAGEIGDIHYISLSRVNLGLYQNDVDVLWDLAVHEISMLLYWLDEDPISAYRIARACVEQKHNDLAFLWFEFPSKVLASCEISWLAPQKLRRTNIVGSKRMVVYDDTSPNEKVKIYDRGVSLGAPGNFGEYHLTYRQGDIVSPNLSNVEPLLVEIEHFLDCAVSGDIPETCGEFSERVVRVLEMAEASDVRETRAAFAAHANSKGENSGHIATL